MIEEFEFKTLVSSIFKNKVLYRKMENITECVFADKSVTYEQFTEELATKIAFKIYQVEKGQLEISQTKAYRMFGRAAVDRWLKSGQLQPCRVMPGKKLYRLIELQKLASVKQNYLIK